MTLFNEKVQQTKIFEDDITMEELEEGFKTLPPDKSKGTYSVELKSPFSCSYVGLMPFYFYYNYIISEWLFETPADELTPEDFLRCKNEGERIAFVDIVGYQKLIKFGKVVDSYKNYPDNEIWTKSEYQIIDMSFLPCYTSAEYKYHLEPQLFCVGNANYAPFLYMKNQTTGAYHLEGLHPRCKTLYDAIKMRYNGLNIKDYDIKDIK